MTSLDNAILEFFYELGGEPSVALPPTVVWWNIVEDRQESDRASSTVNRRMKQLREAGMLERAEQEKGYYRITQLGIDYLENDLDDDDYQDLQDVVDE